MHINHSFSDIISNGNHWRHPLTWCPCPNNAHRLSTLQKVTVAALAIIGVPTLGVGFLAAGLLSAYFKSRNTVWINYTNVPNYRPLRWEFLRSQWWGSTSRVHTHHLRRRDPVHRHGYNPPVHHHSGPARQVPVRPVPARQVPPRSVPAWSVPARSVPVRHPSVPARQVPPRSIPPRPVPVRSGLPRPVPVRSGPPRPVSDPVRSKRRADVRQNASSTYRRAPKENRQRSGTERTRR